MLPPMASPRRIFRIYAQLGADAPLIRDFLEAKGDEVPGTVKRLCDRDAGKLLRKWGEEMHELVGVLDGSHDDPYHMESTQTFYWASLYAAVQDTAWEGVHFDTGRHAAATCGITTTDELAIAVDRLVAAGAEGAKPEKLFLLWNVADVIYRRQTPKDHQLTVEDLMQCDLAEMQKRDYLAPILRQITE